MDENLAKLRNAARALEEAENLLTSTEIHGMNGLAKEVKAIEVQILRRVVDESISQQEDQ